MIGSWLREIRRRRVRERPFPDAWNEILARNVRYHRILPEPDRNELRDLVQVFLDEKHLEGCGGMEITDEVRLTVAAQACVLLLHRETDIYPQLNTVLVYPRHYTAPATRYHGSYAQEDYLEVRSGESWYRGTVVLSWEDTMAGAEDLGEPWNLVYHEFAHQLDDETGLADGTPVIDDPAERAAWVREVGTEYEAHKQAVMAETRTFLDEYAAESPAEFFAVVTEYFFEGPRRLRGHHPGLYDRFRAFYRQDPAALADSAARI